MASTSVYAIMIGGWASNNKFSSISVRASSQMISYELAMGLSSFYCINEWISGSSCYYRKPSRMGRYEVEYRSSACSIHYLFVCSLAECNRAPFDLAECESELINGFHTEYSSMKFGLFLFAEYVNMFISSALITTLFFGGYNYPGIQWVGENWGENAAGIISIVAFLAKAFLFVFILCG